MAAQIGDKSQFCSLPGIFTPLSRALGDPLDRIVRPRAPVQGAARPAGGAGGPALAAARARRSAAPVGGGSDGTGRAERCAAAAMAKWFKEHLIFKSNKGPPQPPKPDYRLRSAGQPDILAAYKLQKERDFEDPYTGSRGCGAPAPGCGASSCPLPNAAKKGAAEVRYISPKHRLIKVENPEKNCGKSPGSPEDQQGKSATGTTLPAWLTSPGPVLLRKHVRSNKYSLLVERVHLLHANPQYAYVVLPDGREDTVSVCDLVAAGAPDHYPEHSTVTMNPAPEVTPRTPSPTQPPHDTLIPGASHTHEGSLTPSGLTPPVRPEPAQPPTAVQSPPAPVQSQPVLRRSQRQIRPPDRLNL
ncbi:uncharacterized protein LOC132390928 [Hypanus sabinus]|uniref:uncharacterized protein LOC132390928 n=1 Tax=Hypanus sabinus TaxID=79690 RepID=UPI0028C50EA5|nr:uncharacterized protein LOC132390928 [Hypanus sabinus]